jgi:hypothetical protein
MPKDEFDFDDPLELNGVSVESAEDTTAAMTECFVEEFLRLGHNHKQILALFRNPHYLGMNLAMEKRGEQFVRDTIAEVFARRGIAVRWAAESGTGFQPVSEKTENGARDAATGKGDKLEAYPTLTDPMGAPLPDSTI